MARPFRTVGYTITPMKYLTSKTKDKLSFAIRGKFLSALSICEEKFMQAHFDNFLNYRTELESMFLPIGDRCHFTETENEFIFNLYLNKTPIYIISEALPHAQNWLHQNNLKLQSICILKTIIENTLRKTSAAKAMLSVGGGGLDWTEGGKDRWGYRAWLRSNGENFDLWNGPMGEI